MCNSLLTTLGTLLARICSQKTFLNCHDVQSVTLSCVQLPQLPTFHLTDTFQDKETKRQRNKETKRQRDKEINSPWPARVFVARLLLFWSNVRVTKAFVDSLKSFLEKGLVHTNNIETHFCRAEDLSLFRSASTGSVALTRRTGDPSVTTRRPWIPIHPRIKWVLIHLMESLSWHLSSRNIQTRRPDFLLGTTPKSLECLAGNNIDEEWCWIQTTMKRASVVGPSALILSGAKSVRGPRAFEFLYFLS